MDLIERKSIKLLSEASKLLAAMMSETLCDEPQKALIRRMLAQTEMLLREFQESYLDELEPADKKRSDTAR
jgi:hypothetical protein